MPEFVDELLHVLPFCFVSFVDSLLVLELLTAHTLECVVVALTDSEIEDTRKSHMSSITARTLASRHDLEDNMTAN